MLGRLLCPSREHSGQEGKGIPQLTQSPHGYSILPASSRQGSQAQNPLVSERSLLPTLSPRSPPEPAEGPAASFQLCPLVPVL